MASKIRVMLSALAILPVVLAAGSSDAHPHAWIDLRTQVKFSDDGDVVGLRQTWIFDEYYTIYALDGLDEDQDGVIGKEALDGLLERIMENLGPYGHFTEVEAGGADANFTLHPERSHRYDDGRLRISFELTFDRPIALARAPLAYGVFDPTYYIEILHDKSDDPIQLVNAPAGCASTLTKPTPSFETVTLAASLDKTESAGDTLGASFAERVTIACE